MDGTILKKNAEVGNIVNSIAFNGSYSLCDMADLCELEVEVTVQERDLAKVFTGQKCTVYTEAYPERKYEGEARIMPIADRSKGAVPVRVKLAKIPREEEGLYLKPEMGAMVIFWSQVREGAPRSMSSTESSADGRIVRVLGVRKFFRRGSERVDVLNGLTLRRAGRGVPRTDGPQRLGQDHAAEPDRRPGHARTPARSGSATSSCRRCPRGSWPAGGPGTSASSSSSTTCCRC